MSHSFECLPRSDPSPRMILAFLRTSAKRKTLRTGICTCSASRSKKCTSSRSTATSGLSDFPPITYASRAPRSHLGCNRFPDSLDLVPRNGPVIDALGDRFHKNAAFLRPDKYPPADIGPECELSAFALAVFLRRKILPRLSSSVQARRIPSSSRCRPPTCRTHEAALSAGAVRRPPQVFSAVRSIPPYLNSFLSWTRKRRAATSPSLSCLAVGVRNRNSVNALGRRCEHPRGANSSRLAVNDPHSFSLCPVLEDGIALHHPIPYRNQAKHTADRKHHSVHEQNAKQKTRFKHG
jgi:hypothetical protein